MQRSNEDLNNGNLMREDSQVRQPHRSRENREGRQTSPDGSGRESRAETEERRAGVTTLGQLGNARYLEASENRSIDRAQMYSFDTGHRMHTNWKNSETGARRQVENIVLEPFERSSPNRDDEVRLDFQANDEVIDSVHQENTKSDAYLLFSSTIDLLIQRKIQLDKISVKLDQAKHRKLAVDSENSRLQAVPKQLSSDTSSLPVEQPTFDIDEFKKQIQQEMKDELIRSQKEKYELEQELSRSKVKELRIQEENYMLSNRVNILESQLSASINNLNIMEAQLTQANANQTSQPFISTIHQTPQEPPKPIPVTPHNPLPSNPSLMVQAHSAAKHLTSNPQVTWSHKSLASPQIDQSVDGSKVDSQDTSSIIRTSLPSIIKINDENDNDDRDEWIKVAKQRWSNDDNEECDVKKKKKVNKKKKKKKSEVFDGPDLRLMSSHLFQENN